MNHDTRFAFFGNRLSTIIQFPSRLTAKCFEAGVVEDVWRALSLNLALLSRLGVGALVASEPGNCKGTVKHKSL